MPDIRNSRPFSQSNRILEKELTRLISRLERLSADSHYAHRASGYRGALLRDLQRVKNKQNLNEHEIQAIYWRIQHAYTILQSAAQEIRTWKGSRSTE